MSLWSLEDRPVFHWDGLQRSLRETAFSGALGSGATGDSLDIDTIEKVIAFIRTVRPPEFPFEVDPELASRGEALFGQHCAGCHARGGARTGSVIPLGEIGTDSHRAFMWGDKDAKAYNDAFAEYPWGFTEFQNVDGYVAIPLDAVWFRAPYLHNGSVPTLAALLDPPEKRPKQFYRGYDVYNPLGVGFVSTVDIDPLSEQRFFLYDTGQAGNSNAGHVYGTTLTSEQKRALIEYLKKE